VCFSVQGGSGRVFCAISRETNKDLAVKVVLCDTAGVKAKELRREYDILAQHRDGDLPMVKPFSQFVFGEFGAGYAMTPRGTGHVLVEDLNYSAHQSTLLQKAFTSLNMLHRVGVIHGDARLANLIRTENGKVVWADLRETCFADGLGYQHDMKTLAASILRHVKPHTSLHADIELYAIVVVSKASENPPLQRIIDRVEELLK
jgi:serine/threonine protein kinase